MNLKNCPKCNRIFVPTSRKYCPSCLQEFENKFDDVKHFLWDNPGSTMSEVVEETGVEEDMIRLWIREGRIESKTLGGEENRCKKCSVTIDHGQYCEKCAQEMAANFQRAAGTLKGKNETKHGLGMFTTDLRKKE